MILFIDSTDFNSVTYWLAGPKLLKKTTKINPQKSHQTLKVLAAFLSASKVHKLRPEIGQIIVNKGPGSYTGTRVGVTHALALGFAWNVKVTALTKEKFAQRLTKLKK